MQQNILDSPLSGITQLEGIYTHARIPIKSAATIQSSIRRQRKNKICRIHTLHPNMEPKIQYTGDDDNSHPLNNEETKYFQSIRDPLVLWTSSRQYHPPSTKRDSHQASKAYGENDGSDKATVGLLRNTGRSHNLVQNK